MAMQRMEPDDRNHTISRILRDRGSSLTSELLDIQQHKEYVQKAHKWADNPLCLRYQSSSPRLFRGIRNRELKKPFVAISWTWKHSKYESQSSGNYWVKHSHTGELEQIKVRNCILDRVTNYLSSMREEIFWLDAVCINQRQEKEKDEAMQSMDLIYKRARKSIALLSTPIMAQFQLDILVRLMNGNYATPTNHRCRLYQNVDWVTMKKVIRLLRHITRDVWWTRGWTFQEEYVAGVDMDILLPLNAGVRSIAGSGDIPGEYCVAAPQFREQATVFLKACVSDHRILPGRADPCWRRYKTICAKILQVVPRYKIMLTKPMSVRIYRDIGRRNVTYPWDTLAITANSCGYSIRLDKRTLFQRKKSLSLCLLAQFLLNGEITSSHWELNGLLNVPVYELLEKITLLSQQPSEFSHQLSFFKHCRWGRVKLHNLGSQTKGLVWELKPNDCVDTSGFNLPMLPESMRRYLRGRPWESMELEALYHDLTKCHRDVAEHLDEYIHGRRSGRSWAGSSYMDAMAWHLVKAIQKGYLLRIGYLRGSRAGSIFLPRGRDKWRPMHVLSTWQFGEMHEYGLDNYVSVEVSVQEEGVLDPSRWMTGLLFLRRTEMESVIVRSF